MKKFLILMLIMMGLTAAAWAQDKTWNAEGDATDWSDDANWLTAGKPTVSDNAKVDMQNASVDIGQFFEAKKLTVGGKKPSTVNVSNFVTGTLTPTNETDEGLIARRDGKVILKGSAGKITLKGTYKDSEELIPDEPSFMLYVK